jgi:hypothetical protein
MCADEQFPDGHQLSFDWTRVRHVEVLSLKFHAELMLVNKFDSDFKNEMKVGGGRWLLILSKAHQLFRASGQRSVLLSIAFSDYNSKGLADQAYCEVLETEVPNTVQYLLDRKQDHGFLRTHFTDIAWQME